MKTYTGKQYTRRLVIAGLGALVYAVGMVVFAQRGEHLPGGEWIPAFSFVLTVIMGALLWEWTSNILPLRGSFLIDQHDRIVAYVCDVLFVNVEQLNRRKWRAVRHTLQDTIVDGTHLVRVADGGKEIMVRSTVWVNVDPYRLQDYFDTFLKASGSPTPEKRVQELIDGCEFFQKQDRVVFNADSSDLVAPIVGKQLAKRLNEGLKSSGLRVELVACVATD